MPMLTRLCLLLACAGLLVAAGKGVSGGATQAAQIELGRRLFYDADLSADGSMACSSCHVQRHGFADSVATHPGVHGEAGRRNAPGLANVTRARSLTWSDPRVRTLEAQVSIPVLGDDPVEMGMKGQEAEIARRLGRDPCYVSMFRAAFPDMGGRIDMTTVTRAIAAFERSMISDDAPFDHWRRGARDALTPAQRQGSRLFARDCASCHAGADMSDGRFHAIETAGRDKGLGAVTGKAGDDGRFRTPMLRNVALTAPYLHDGSARTLGEAIARHRSVRLDAGQMAAIIAFLDAMTDRSFLSDRRYALPDSACGRAL